MKLKKSPLASLICVSLLGSAALSNADVLVAENFDSYADGALNGANASSSATPGREHPGPMVYGA